MPGERDTKQDTFNKLIKTSAGLMEHVMLECVGACESLICLHTHRDSNRLHSAKRLQKKKKIRSLIAGYPSNAFPGRIWKQPSGLPTAAAANQHGRLFQLNQGQRLRTCPQVFGCLCSRQSLLPSTHFRRRASDLFRSLVKLVLIRVNLGWRMLRSAVTSRKSIGRNTSAFSL